MKGREHRDVRNAHANDVRIDLCSPSLPPRCSTEQRCAECQGANSEKMVVVSPPHRC
jgi:hypothetical protein